MAATRPAPSLLSGDLARVQAEVDKRHDESIQRLQHWVRNPSISAEDRGMDEGCELLVRMAREAGFQKAARIDTDGHPGVFATLDAGAPRTFGLYF
ncbi:MAG: twin-arginine translocation pathway signal protein, partial [Chloroflexi bacterium]